jgi:hypothetical protein
MFLNIISMVMLLQGCSKDEGTIKRDTRVPHTGSVSRSWINLKNPQIAYELRQLRILPEVRFDFMSLTKTLDDLPQSEISKHVEGHMERTLGISGSSSVAGPEYCLNAYGRLSHDMGLRRGQMVSMVQDVNRLDLAGVKILSISLLAGTPFSENIVVFESRSLFADRSVDIQRLKTEKADILLEVIANPQINDTVATYRRTVDGFSAEAMISVILHAMISFNRNTNLILTKASECLAIVDQEKGYPKSFVGRVGDPVFHVQS